jgi:hypothetical protein
MLRGNFHIDKIFGMIASRKRLWRSLNPVRKKMERRN